MKSPDQWEKSDLIKALEASIKLQSHYARLLNQYDGGQRLIFDDANAWLDRLLVIGSLSEDRDPH